MRRTFDKKMWLGGALVAMLAGCGAPPTAKSKPTWVDVYPILAGRCLHCHGADAEAVGGKQRFDFLSPMANCGDLVARAEVGPFLGGAVLVPSATTIEEGASRPKMPPAPSPALQDWEIEMLDNWVKNKAAPGAVPKGNGRPTLTITRARKSGDNAELTYLIEDPDGDPVLGEITIGDKAFPVKSAGSNEDPLEVPTASKLTVTAELCDGWQTVTREVEVTVK